MTLEASCEKLFQLGASRAKVKVLRTSSLTAAGSLVPNAKEFDQPHYHKSTYSSYQEDPKMANFRASVFISGEVDTEMKVDGKAHLEIGKRIFGKCFKKGGTEVPLHIEAKGKIWLGANIFTDDVRLEERPLKPNQIPALLRQLGDNLEFLRNAIGSNVKVRNPLSSSYGQDQGGHNGSGGHKYYKGQPLNRQDQEAEVMRRLIGRPQTHLVFRIQIKLNAKVREKMFYFLGLDFYWHKCKRSVEPHKVGDRPFCLHTIHLQSIDLYSSTYGKNVYKYFATPGGTS